MIMTSYFGSWRADDEGTSFLEPRVESEVSPLTLRSIHRHLAVAAAQLSGSDGLDSEQAARYLAVGSRFRALVEIDGDLRKWSLLPCPLVDADSGVPIPLAAMLIAICQRKQIRLPLRSIEPELVHEAKQLLCELSWRLPDQESPLSQQTF